MSENPGTPSTPEPQAGTGDSAGSTPAGKAPTFEGDFDAEKAARLVANLRAEVAELKAAKKAETKPATKPADDDVTSRIAALEAELRASKRAASAATVAAATGVPGELLVGDTDEALKAHADRLVAWADQRAKATATPRVPGRPRERFAPVTGAGAATGEADPVAIAKAARNRF